MLPTRRAVRQRYEQQRTLLPGMVLSIIIAMAAGFVSSTYGGPTILFALLLGMSLNFLATDERFKPGLTFSSRTVLRVGVALLGARITLSQIAGLGWTTLAGVAIAVALTIGFGYLAARALGLRRRFGILTGAAVAICGASAAAAVSAILPRYETRERDTAFTIIGVTTLSTMAMVLYPVLVAWLGLDPEDAGVFLGGTIHDVAQVVGAGYSVSPEAGDAATIIKLLRVSLLLPTALLISLLGRRLREDDRGRAPGLVPGFLVAFFVIVALNSIGAVPAWLQSSLSEGSRWCIVTAIAALGVKTALATMAKVGHRAIGLMVGETILIAVFVLVLVSIR